MRKIELFFVVFIILLATGFILFSQVNSTSKTIKPTPIPIHKITPTPTIPVTVLASTSLVSFCKTNNINATITTQGAAGNIYGNLVIQNTSAFSCKTQGNQFINVVFSAANIKVIPQGKTGPTTITLSPHQKVYSQIHYPNGPQCNGPSKQTPVTYTYAISPIDSVTFTSGENTSATSVTTCVSPNQTTQLDVWSIYLQPDIQ